MYGNRLVVGIYIDVCTYISMSLFPHLHTPSTYVYRHFLQKQAISSAPPTLLPSSCMMEGYSDAKSSVTS